MLSWECHQLVSAQCPLEWRGHGFDSFTNKYGTFRKTRLLRVISNLAHTKLAPPLGLQRFCELFRLSVVPLQQFVLTCLKLCIYNLLTLLACFGYEIFYYFSVTSLSFKNCTYLSLSTKQQHVIGHFYSYANLLLMSYFKFKQLSVRNNFLRVVRCRKLSSLLAYVFFNQINCISKIFAKQCKMSISTIESIKRKCHFFNIKCDVLSSLV